MPGFGDVIYCTETLGLSPISGCWELITMWRASTGFAPDAGTAVDPAAVAAVVME